MCIWSFFLPCTYSRVCQSASIYQVSVALHRSVHLGHAVKDEASGESLAGEALFHVTTEHILCLMPSPLYSELSPPGHENSGTGSTAATSCTRMLLFPPTAARRGPFSFMYKQVPVLILFHINIHEHQNEKCTI